MSRAIDAESLKENAFSVFTQEYGVIEVVGVDAIDESPTIEPQVAEGEWVQPYVLFSDRVCSNCGYKTTSSNAKNYCPNCGAKMRGDAHE